MRVAGTGHSVPDPLRVVSPQLHGTLPAIPGAAWLLGHQHAVPRSGDQSEPMAVDNCAKVRAHPVPSITCPRSA